MGGCMYHPWYFHHIWWKCSEDFWISLLSLAAPGVYCQQTATEYLCTYHSSRHLHHQRRYTIVAVTRGSWSEVGFLRAFSFWPLCIGMYFDLCVLSILAYLSSNGFLIFLLRKSSYVSQFWHYYLLFTCFLDISILTYLLRKHSILNSRFYEAIILFSELSEASRKVRKVCRSFGWLYHFMHDLRLEMPCYRLKLPEMELLPKKTCIKIYN